jgi:hypothetical protein
MILRCKDILIQASEAWSGGRIVLSVAGKIATARPNDGFILALHVKDLLDEESAKSALARNTFS